MRQALDASCESMRIETLRRRPCCRAGKIVHHARGRILKLCDAQAARRLSEAVGMIRAMALAPQPPPSQKKCRSREKKSLRPGALRTVIDPLPRFRLFRLRHVRKPARHRRGERQNLPAPRIAAENSSKKISNADFGLIKAGLIIIHLHLLSRRRYLVRGSSALN